MKCDVKCEMKCRPSGENIPLPKHDVSNIKAIDELDTNELEELCEKQETRYKKIESEINSHIQQVELNNLYMASIDRAIDSVDHLFAVNMFSSKESEEIYSPYVIKIPYKEPPKPSPEAKRTLGLNIKISREAIKGQMQQIKNEEKRKRKLEEELAKTEKGKSKKF